MGTSAFLDHLWDEVQTLQGQFPDLSAGLVKAHRLLREGRLFLEESGKEASVLASDGTQSYHTNGTCTCKAAQYHDKPCCHRLALRLYQKVADRLTAEQERWELAVDLPPALQVPQEYLISVQGKPFVRFAGLLALAHAHGLVALETTVVSVTPELAVCQCTARLAEGRTCTDIGDASPTNVARHLAPHFIRMAATRASARALRRALNISACSVEELGDEVGAYARPV